MSVLCRHWENKTTDTIEHNFGIIEERSFGE